jgi:Flp pilus assembly protein TadG
LGSKTRKIPPACRLEHWNADLKGIQERGESQRKVRSMKKKVVMRKLFGLAREERGSELVEFAITASLLIFLLLGVLQWMFAMYGYHFATYAAQQGTRFAMVRGNTWSENLATNCSTSAPPNFTMKFGCTASSTDIQNYVKSLATAGINPSNVTINTTSSYVWPGKTPDGVTCSTTNSQGCLVKVTVTYAFNFLPFLPMPALSMSATSEAAILQ